MPRDARGDEAGLAALTPRGGRLHKALALLRLLAGQRWLTERELTDRVVVTRRAVNRTLACLSAEGVLRSRHRVHELRADGTRPAGCTPREYRLRTDWAELGT